MNPGLHWRGLLSWPLVFAILFLCVPPLLFYSYPCSLWAVTDYEMLGLADALNMAYRLADFRMYPARGMMDHPGVPFYLMSWLALALTGYPVASRGLSFFSSVIEHVEEYHQITIWLGALTGAAGVYVIARVSRNLVPTGVVAAGLLLWLVSTPATLLMFSSPSIESFALLVNGLFFAVMVRIAYDRDITSNLAIVAGSVGALAYLNKLSYIYIPLALAMAGILNLFLRRFGWIRGILHSALFVSVLLSVIVATGFFFIGREGFHDLLMFHQNVFYGSGLYGTGDQVVTSRDQIWHAVTAMLADKGFAIPIALVGGAGLVIAGLLTGLKRPQHLPPAVLAIGAGLASLLSALIVLKHYGAHYAAGVSATLPFMVVSGHLLARAWGRRFQIAEAVVAAAAVLFLASQTMPLLTLTLSARTNTSRQVQADLQEIQTHVAGIKGAVEFVYKAPFARQGEGFVVTYGSVPRLTSDYVLSRQDAFSSMTAGLFDREVGAYVIDKSYFPTAESIKKASNFALLATKPVSFKDGDRLIELRTVFLLIPG